MEHIFQPDASFDFSPIHLATPVAVAKETYFTKLLYQGRNLYVQTPLCGTKGGLAKSGNKWACDLLFNNSHEIWIQWIEQLETHCQKKIFEKSTQWFDTQESNRTLDAKEIEEAFASSLRLYKSGKFYLLKTLVKSHTLTQQPMVKLYDENEKVLTQEEVNADKDQAQVIGILEIQGIKFSNKHFQLEYELKQMMVRRTDPLLETCLIQMAKPVAVAPRPVKKPASQPEVKETAASADAAFLNELTRDIVLQETKAEVHTPLPWKEAEEKEEEEDEEHDTEVERKVRFSPDTIDPTLHIGAEADSGQLSWEIEEVVDPDAPPAPEVVVEAQPREPDTAEPALALKKPQEIYYEIYRVAKEKAKEARQKALDALMEAKNIKQRYLLEDASDDEDGNGSELGSDADASLDWEGEFSDSDSQFSEDRDFATVSLKI